MKYRPLAEKSAWLTPEHCTFVLFTNAMVCGSRQSIRFIRSAITTAYLPSGVKYRLYGSSTETGLPGLPVAGSMGTSALPVSLFTHSVFRSYDGTTCCGCPGTAKCSTIWKVFGSMTSTVLLLLFGT